MQYFAQTDKGHVRQVNEDYFYGSSSPVGALPNLFIVCDGMGGHNAGEYASSIAAQQMLIAVSSIRSGDPFTILDRGVLEANRVIYERASEDPEKTGMGTTMVVATIVDSVLYVANVGDSRLYVHDGEKFYQVTRDHSYVAEMVRKGVIRKEEARFHRDRNKITRAVGVLQEVRTDFFDVELNKDSQVLMCTDGLTGMLYDDEIAQILSDYKEPKDKVAQLIDQANERGGRDNITAVLITMT